MFVCFFFFAYIYDIVGSSADYKLVIRYHGLDFGMMMNRVKNLKRVDAPNLDKPIENSIARDETE